MWTSRLSYVTQLKKGVKVPETEVIKEANAWIEPDFSVVEHPLRVLDQKVKDQMVTREGGVNRSR
jgi:hypothetical protein